MSCLRSSPGRFLRSLILACQHAIMLLTHMQDDPPQTTRLANGLGPQTTAVMESRLSVAWPVVASAAATGSRCLLLQIPISSKCLANDRHIRAKLSGKSPCSTALSGSADSVLVYSRHLLEARDITRSID